MDKLIWNKCYYKEIRVSTLFGTDSNWQSVVAVFLDVHNSESALKVCLQGREITYQTQW
jgi:hypothetical protein